MFRTRIAPTPSGYLHFGNLYSFVLTWLLAKGEGGIVVLRIDDLDASRVRDGYVEDIFKVLDFIGLQPDEGPSGVAEFKEKYSQHHRFFLYKEQKEKLMQNGMLYPCLCSRSQLIRSFGNVVYPGICRDEKLSLNYENHTLRIKLPVGAMQSYLDLCTQTERQIDLESEIGDFVIWRKDGLPAYQLASIVDDRYFNINFIVRGDDLKVSSGAQKWLAGKLGLKVFDHMEWYHHHLILNASGNKLSKSAGDSAVSSLMHQGASKRDLLFQIAQVLNIPQKPYLNLQELLEEFHTRAAKP
jgi:glutamyl/glutaminyl-tRNA synthetase